MINKEDLGKLIQEKRKEKSITQQELAKLLNVSDKAISNWETGKNYPDIIYLNELDKLLGLDINNTLKDKRRRARIIKLISLIFVICLIIVSSCLFYYYNKYKNRYLVYEITAKEKYDIQNSFLLMNNKTIMISMNKITSEYLEDNSTIDVTLTVEGFGDIFYRKNYAYADLSFNLLDKDYEALHNNLDKLYLKIDYTNSNGKKESDMIQLIVKEVFEETEPTMDTKSKVNLLLNNGYREAKKNYYEKKKILNNYIINLSYSLDEQKFYYEYTEKEMAYVFTLDEKENTLSCLVLKNDLINSVIEDFTYDISNKVNTCNIGNCSNAESIIELVNSEYLYLKN